MEKDSHNTNISTAVTGGLQDETAKTDSNESFENDRPRIASNLTSVCTPIKSNFQQGGLATKRRTTTFKSLAKTPLSTWQWKAHKGLLYGLSNSTIKSSQKIAMFDMDGTLITNKNGRRASDWEFLFPCIPEKLRELFSQGFRVVIASNQLGISLNLVSEKDLQKKVEQFIAVVGIEATVMLATKSDRFRKPDTGMWNFLENFLNTTSIARDQSVDWFDLVLCWRFCRQTCLGQQAERQDRRR